MSKVLEQNKPTSTPLLKRTFIGWYLQGNLPPQALVFEYVGTLPQAIVKFRDHCSKMSIKFVRVRPFIVDLDIREKYKFSNPDWEDDQDIPGVT